MTTGWPCPSACLFFPWDTVTLQRICCPLEHLLSWGCMLPDGLAGAGTAAACKLLCRRCSWMQVTLLVLMLSLQCNHGKDHESTTSVQGCDAAPVLQDASLQRPPDRWISNKHALNKPPAGMQLNNLAQPC